MPALARRTQWMRLIARPLVTRVGGVFAVLSWLCLLAGQRSRPPHKEAVSLPQD